MLAKHRRSAEYDSGVALDKTMKAVAAKGVVVEFRRPEDYALKRHGERHASLRYLWLVPPGVQTAVHARLAYANSVVFASERSVTSVRMPEISLGKKTSRA